MYKLYHQNLCPFSRKIRILLAAKEVEFELCEEPFWEKRREFITINTMGTIPVLFDSNNGNIIPSSSNIVEYIEEKYNETDSFIGNSLMNRVESRRLQCWFDEKFFNEVSKVIINERYFNRFIKKLSSPSSDNLRIALSNLNIHFRYMEFLLENRKYLVGNDISIADFAAAGHISVLDFLGDINWQGYSLTKQWYELVKSQKIFSEILKDKVAHITPPSHYALLDF